MSLKLPSFKPNAGDFCSLQKVDKIDTWTVASSVSGHGRQERLGFREVDVDPGDVGDNVGRPEGIVFDIFHLKINEIDEAVGFWTMIILCNGR
jgi:hypothetical protein